MKQKLLLLIFIVCLQFQNARSQINFNDNWACYGSLTNWSLTGTVAGHNSYTDNYVTVIWSVGSNRWEIRDGGIIDYYNYTNTSPNPPALGVGMWVNNGMCGPGNIVQFDGPYTMSAVSPTVTTTAASNIGSLTAILGGNVTADGGAGVTERGIVWATTQNPTTANNKAVNGSGTGSFSSTVSGLTVGVTIYVRAYAINFSGTAYGNEVSFTTNAALSATQSQTNACNTTNNGTATVTPAGGKTPYTYLWSNGATSAGVIGLAPNNYSVLITDSEGTSTLKNYTITEYAAISGTATPTIVTCNGGSDGTITLTPSGGVGPYTYDWGGGVTSQNRSGLSAGNYSVIITDTGTGCTGTVNTTVPQPLSVSGSAIITDVTCKGQNTGAIDLTPLGGTPGTYTYLWNDGVITEDRVGLIAGTYTVVIRDVNNCPGTVILTVGEPVAALVATAGPQTNVLCHGNTTGSATVNVTGGTGAYVYNWSPSGGTAATATGLAAGTYTVTVTDGNLCSTTQVFTITQPTAPLVATAGPQTNVLCYGNATGSATVNVTGGTGAYVYSWSPSGGTAATATGLASGTYTVTVTDGNLCSTTQVFTITQPTAPLVATAGPQTNALCHGNATGSATVNVTGGTGTYVYDWSPSGGTAATATGLASGTYTVTVTDANLCSTTQAFTITQPVAPLTLTPNTTQANVLCNGQATGSATLAVTGGTGAYTYLWSNGAVTNTITGVTAGTYGVTVTDANGCTISNSFVIIEPTALVATAGPQTNVLCHGNATGSATVNVTGGTGTYVYNWSPSGGTAETATGLAAGTYTVTVTDANLCSTTQVFTITQPTAPLVATPGPQTNVLCYGNATGSATVNVTGGTGTYVYSWSPSGGTAATATGLASGTYTVTVTDANLCSTTQAFTITQPVAPLTLTPNTTQANVLCNGQATGSATLAVTGGTGAYTYLWSNGAVTNTITGVTAGTYGVTVTDANGCTISNSFVITEPTALVATAGPQTNVLCHGNATGSATVNVTGGTGTYVYNWSPSGGTAATATGLAAGTYTVTVTDANLCSTTQSFTITQPSQALATTPNTSHVNVSCFGGANGSATIAVNGGTTPYTYLWSNTQTNATATGLTAGTYNVVVTDANGCTLSGSFTITQPTALVAMAGPQTNVSCFGAANGSATVNVTGGTGVYSYSWNTTPVQTAATAAGLAPGNYTVTITDANLCTATQDFTITQPQQLTAGVNNYTNVLCFGAATGSATVSVAGGTLPYSYQWSNGQAIATATNLTAGTYSVVVTDANGCQINAGITITQPAAPLFLVASQVNVNCVTATNGSITINATGGVGPYTYTWTPAVSTTNFADNLGVGNYNVVVTDANGCSDIRYVSIAAPTAVTGYFTVTDATCYLTGSAVVHASGGVAPYTYLWSNGSITDSVQDVLPGTYSVTITDTNGCIYTLTTMINGTDPIVITSHPQDVAIDGGEDAVFTVAAQNVTTYQWQVSDDGGLTYTNLNSGGGPPYYYGVSTPTLTITNAYGFANGYKYRVILLKQSGCYVLTDAGTLNVNPVVVGTDDIKRMEMTVYPNPASSDLFVKIPDYGLYGNVKVAMYDLNGRIVRSEEVITSENYRIDVTELESAVYIVSITSDAGRTDKKVTIKK